LKRKIFFTVIIIFLCCCSVAFGEDYVDTGSMSLDQYSYLVGLAGVVCGLVFSLGLNQ
jgi:hypothetical protein